MTIVIIIFSLGVKSAALIYEIEVQFLFPKVCVVTVMINSYYFICGFHRKVHWDLMKGEYV
jgi:hypothetical protein